MSGPAFNRNKKLWPCPCLLFRHTCSGLLPCIVSGFSPKAWAQCLIKLPCFIFSPSARPQYGSSGLSLIFAPPPPLCCLFFFSSVNPNTVVSLWASGGVLRKPPGHIRLQTRRAGHTGPSQQPGVPALFCLFVFISVNPKTAVSLRSSGGPLRKPPGHNRLQTRWAGHILPLLLQTGISRLIKLPCFIFSASARPQYCSPGLSTILAPFVCLFVFSSVNPKDCCQSPVSRRRRFANLQATVDSRLGGQVTLAPALSQQPGAPAGMVSNSQAQQGS